MKDLRTSCVLLAVVLLLAACSLRVVGPSPAQAAARGDFDENAEREVLRLLNQARQREGLAPLTFEERLKTSARQHTVLLAEHQDLSHQFPGEPKLRDRVAATGLRFNRVAENVGYNSSPEAAHEGFMNSPRHRANRMNPDYSAVGIGVIRVGRRLYVTENFAHRLEEISDADAEQKVATAIEGMRRRARQPLERVPIRGMREAACRMAQREKLDTRAVPRPDSAGASSVAVYSASEPDELPPSVLRQRDSNFHRYSLGLCFARTANYPSGMYWVAVLFY